MTLGEAVPLGEAHVPKAASLGTAAQTPRVAARLSAPGATEPLVAGLAVKPSHAVAPG